MSLEGGLFLTQNEPEGGRVHVGIDSQNAVLLGHALTSLGFHIERN